MKKLATAILLLVACLFLPGQAQAHVLITDTTGRLGGVLHLTPDDDPIAGEPSHLYLDVQSSAFQAKDYSLNLQITPQGGQAVAVPMHNTTSSIGAEYTFPAQGSYHIELTAQPVSGKGQSLIFRYDQRIVRGLVSATQTNATPAWAELGLLASLCGLAFIGMVVFNKRREIAAYTRQHSQK